MEDDRSSISRILLRRQRRSPGEPAVVEVSRQRELVTTAWDELLTQARHFGLGLCALGVDRGDVVGIVEPAGPEAMIVVLGALLVGAKVADLGDGADRELCIESLQRANCRLVICGAREHAEDIVPEMRQRGMERGLIGWGAASSVNAVYPFGQVCLKGIELSDREPVRIAERIAAVRAEDIAIVLPDSHRDGSFREVRLSHDNCIVSAESFRKSVGVGAEDRVVALGRRGLLEQVLLALVAALTGASLVHGVDELSPLVLTQASRATVAIANSDVLDALHRELHRELLDGAAWRRRSSNWALRVGNEVARRRISGSELGPFLTVSYFLADHCVLKEVRRLLGDGLRRIIVPGAHTRRQTRWFFESIGISPLGFIAPAEAGGIGLMELPDEPRPGSYGRGMPGVDVWVDAVGRIRIRGANVSKTAPGVDPSGWLDLEIVGEIDDEGMIWPERAMGALDAPSLAMLPIAEHADPGDS